MAKFSLLLLKGRFSVWDISFSRNYGGVALVLLSCPLAFEIALEINRASEVKPVSTSVPQRKESNFRSMLRSWKKSG
jgi:hypothetical protein